MNNLSYSISIDAKILFRAHSLRSLITPAYMDPGSFRLETKVRGRDLYVMLQGIEREKNRVR